MPGRYSFRLTEDDKELYRLLERVPTPKRSEAIREMLKFAYRKAVEEEKENQKLERIEKLVLELREEIEKRFSELENKSVVVSSKHTNSGEKVSGDSVKKSAEALLASFGTE